LTRISAVLQFTGIFPLSYIIDNFGGLMTVAVISGILISIAVYVGAFVTGTTHRMTGNHVYDFFMGAPLNPRIGILDLKMFAEIRIPWIILFYISVSAAAKFYEINDGYIPSTILFMVLGHFLYVNACHKGEELIPPTWDMYYEKWGFMIIFWNFAGVPFVYSMCSLYLIHTETGRHLHHNPFYTAFLYCLLLFAYWVWDTGNSQKNRFRMMMTGDFLPRKTFPQLPWGTLENPTYIRTKHGSLLLTSGWYGIVRKAHYMADFTMAMSWALMTGFGSPVPYFYPVFFAIMIIHRTIRDNEKCAKKYGDDWVTYTKKVPYIFIPYIY
ncbi:C-24(28) sterol reductase, partial [Cladochytrium tenue]